MREFVGVRAPLGVDTLSLKRDALIFSRVGILGLGELSSGQINTDVGQSKWVQGISPATSSELLWLSERNIIFEPDLSRHENLLTDADYAESYTAELNSARKVKQAIEEIHRLSTTSKNEGEIRAALDRIRPLVDEGYNRSLAALQYMVRRVSVQLRITESVDAFPVLPLTFLPHAPSHADRGELIRLSLNALPVPDDTTPWEQILEYRSDPDSRSKFLALRHWMGEVARAELTPAEVEEKLEYLIDQYQRHMRLHRMKTNVGTLETVVTAGAEVLGDLVSFKWGKAAQALFSLKRREVALLEGELTAPGKEVAYIVKARETFGSE